jgi:hypothetical protein
MHGKDLTISVSLKNAVTYLLPAYKGDSAQEMPDIDEEAPVRIRWGNVSTLTEGASVFVGGSLVYQEERWQFVSTKKNPLIVIFYDGPVRLFTTRVIQSCRQQWEYWNTITPYSLIIGALCLILLAFSFLHRPIFRPTVILSFVSLFIPLYPIIPPGLLFTVFCRRLALKSRIYKAYSDLARLPLRYLSPEDKKNDAQQNCRQDCKLPNGEQYGFISKEDMPQGQIPLLLPESAKLKQGFTWRVFGALRPGEDLPSQPDDPFATFGMLQGDPLKLARQFKTKAYALEVLTCILLLTGIGLNIVFFLGIVMVLI